MFSVNQMIEARKTRTCKENHFAAILQIVVLGFVFSACASTVKLEEGNWSGTLVPMNHPDLKTDLVYTVRYPDDKLEISIVGPDGSVLPTKNPRIADEVLLFSFIEPEQQAELHCELSRQWEGGFSGRCTDSEGKFALFTMIPP